MIKNTRFVIDVPDLKKSSAYYRDVLGFSVRDLGPCWMLYTLEGCLIMAGEWPGKAPDGYFAYIEIDDIETQYKRLISAKADILKELVSEPWGMKECLIRTVDGHKIMFGQDLG
jgi:catechol 2,3-dioxygenase-like lactoylglutathione lyase family enzyme